MRAKIVLEDCRRALELAENARNEQDFRIHWIALLALLRTVGHVLDKVDASTSPLLRSAVDARWEEWRNHQDEYHLFWDFIETERNSVLKNYESGIQPGDIPVATVGGEVDGFFILDGCIFKPLLNGPFAGEDGRDVARDAIVWWEKELEAIANASISAQRRD